MERIILQVYEWNLQLPNVIEIIQTFLSQGVIYQSDQIIMEN